MGGAPGGGMGGGKMGGTGGMSGGGGGMSPGQFAGGGAPGGGMGGGPGGKMGGGQGGGMGGQGGGMSPVATPMSKPGGGGMMGGGIPTPMPPGGGGMGGGGGGMGGMSGPQMAGAQAGAGPARGGTTPSPAAMIAQKRMAQGGGGMPGGAQMAGMGGRPPPGAGGAAPPPPPGLQPPNPQNVPAPRGPAGPAGPPGMQMPPGPRMASMGGGMPASGAPLTQPNLGRNMSTGGPIPPSMSSGMGERGPAATSVPSLQELSPGSFKSEQGEARVGDTSPGGTTASDAPQSMGAEARRRNPAGGGQSRSGGKMRSGGGGGGAEFSPANLAKAEHNQPVPGEQAGPIFPFPVNPEKPGGPTPNVERLSPDYVAKVNRAWEKASPSQREGAEVISGYRPATEHQAQEVGGGVRSQEAIRRDKKAGINTGKAAPVGTSLHGSANAADFRQSPFLNYLHGQGGREQGLRGIGRGDYPHIQSGRPGGAIPPGRSYGTGGGEMGSRPPPLTNVAGTSPAAAPMPTPQPRPPGAPGMPGASMPGEMPMPGGAPGATPTPQPRPPDITSYYPGQGKPSMEGGPLGNKGDRLNKLDRAISGDAPHVSVAGAPGRRGEEGSLSGKAGGKDFNVPYKVEDIGGAKRLQDPRASDVAMPKSMAGSFQPGGMQKGVMPPMRQLPPGSIQRATQGAGGQAPPMTPTGLPAPGGSPSQPPVPSQGGGAIPPMQPGGPPGMPGGGRPIMPGPPQGMPGGMSAGLPQGAGAPNAPPPPQMPPQAMPPQGQPSMGQPQGMPPPMPGGGAPAMPPGSMSQPQPPTPPAPPMPRPQGAPPPGQQRMPQPGGRPQASAAELMRQVPPNASHEQKLQHLVQNAHRLDPQSRQQVQQINRAYQRERYGLGPERGGQGRSEPTMWGQNVPQQNRQDFDRGTYFGPRGQEAQQRGGGQAAQPVGRTSQGQPVHVGAQAHNPQTGEVLQFNGRSWEPMAQQRNRRNDGAEAQMGIGGGGRGQGGRGGKKGQNPFAAAAKAIKPSAIGGKGAKLHVTPLHIKRFHAKRRGA